ncbi:MAG: gamma-glutamyl-gamma-aminobutyrate hydrolase family protein [Terriglobales bacterium]
MKPRIAIPVPHSEGEYAQRALVQYEEAVRKAGGEPVAIALDRTNQQVAQAAKGCDGVLLPGSKADIDPEKYGCQRDPHTAAADPARDNVDELLLQDAFNMHKPILGICYGLQALNVWRSGTLVQHLETGVNHAAGREVQRAHAVAVELDSRLGGIVAPLQEFAALCAETPKSPAETVSVVVNSSHHQGAGIVGDGLRVAARSQPDGVIEALEGTDPDHFVIAVQWHPERSFGEDEPSRAIFQAFIQAALSRHQQPRTPVPDFESLSK